MKQHFIDLVHKYLTNSLSASEQEELAALSRLPENIAVLEEMVQGQLEDNAFAGPEDPVLKAAMFRQLEFRMGTLEIPEAAPSATPTRRISWRSWAAAAAILVAFVMGGQWLAGIPDDVPPPVARQDVPPGSNKALLTLADGSVIELDDTREGSVASQGGVTVIKIDSGLLSYKNEGRNAKPVINTISTPRGGEYQVVLPDGSHVWLNSASSLSFPTAFTGAERLVTLTGEGFFEVAKNPAKPFRVKASETTVEVLGTSFNIMAYTNEPEQSTTLVSGVVRLQAGGKTEMLKPGQQAVRSNENGSMRVQQADVEEAIAWKNGRFRFAGRNIGAIMRQIERWYDVEVEIRGDLSGVVLSGLVSRKEYVSQLLEALEETGDVHFETAGKRITVYPGSRN